MLKNMKKHTFALCFCTILVYFSHLFLLLLLCGIKPVNFISYYSITSYLHIAVVFSSFQSFARSCNSTFFTSILAIGKKMKIQFLNCTSWCRWAKNFYSVKLPKLSVFFCPIVFLIIYYFICFNTFYA